MPTLARSHVSSVSNPVLDTYIVADGVLTNVYSLEFVIHEFATSRTAATLVTPLSGRTAIDVVAGRVSTGRYAVPFTVGGAAPIGVYRVTFYFKVLSTDTEQSFTQFFEVIGATYGDVSGNPLATVQSMRDEGVPVSAYSDAVLLQKLLDASQEVEDYTSRTFGPTYREILVDGTGAEALLLEDPIIGISDIAIVSSDVMQEGTVNMDTLRVYNRHITQNLREPDDRENPKVEFYSSEYYDYYGSRVKGSALLYRHWPAGKQNISVKGVFGYTEPNGTPTGGVPQRVAVAVRMLAMMNLPVLSDVDARMDAGQAWQTVSERTRDQSISRFSGVDAASRAAVIGAVTGSPTLDRILVQYRRGPKLGSA